MTDSGAIKGLDAREDGVYITYVPSAGADPVTKKLGSPIFRDYTMTVSGWNGSKTITFPEHHPSYPNTTYVGIIGYTMYNVDIQFPQMTMSGRNMYFPDDVNSVSVTIRYMEI